MATICTINKGQALQYTTDKMGSVIFKAIQHKDGVKECFVMREEEGYWKTYDIENFETIVNLTKYQTK